MYHFLVTADTKAWEIGFEEFSRSRFLEYTNDDIQSKFETLTPTHIELLKTFPCLCAYEGQEDLRIGWIKEIKVDRRTIRVDIDFDNTANQIQYEELEPYKAMFGIHEWEFSRTHWAIKDEDLFSRLSKAGIQFRPLATTQRSVTTVADVPAIEPTRPKVSSVVEFIEAVKNLKDGGGECFYRGHSAIAFRLAPSVFRTHPNGVPLYRDSEHEIYRELLVSNSFDFRDDDSTLDRLVRMQHYSLPTRLLDITANPLIALYFAARSRFEEEGEVVLFLIDRSKVKYFDSDTASCIANLALLSAKDRDSISFDLEPPIDQSNLPGEDPKIKAFNAQTQVERLLHYIGNEKPYFKPRINPEDLQSIICVKGKRNNNRISSQSGAFLLFGHEAQFQEEGTESIVIKRIAIQKKQQILHDLELLNINESTVFPNIESSARHIAEKFKTKINSAENASQVDSPSDTSDEL